MDEKISKRSAVRIEMWEGKTVVNSWYVKKVKDKDFQLAADLIELSIGADSDYKIREQLRKITFNFYDS